MEIPEGLQFTSIYDLRWGGLFDFPDFYLIDYCSDYVEDRFLLDPQGCILAFRHLTEVSKYKRFCGSEYLAFRSPLFSFPHIQRTGALGPGDAVVVFFKTAIDALAGEEDYSKDNLLQVLSLIDGILTSLKRDHKCVFHGCSGFIAQLCLVQRATYQTGIIADAFPSSEAQLEYVSEFKAVLQYIMSRITFVS